MQIRALDKVMAIFRVNSFFFLKSEAFDCVSEFSSKIDDSNCLIPFLYRPNSKANNDANPPPNASNNLAVEE